jgi:hypothetical protein
VSHEWPVIVIHEGAYSEIYRGSFRNSKVHESYSLVVVVMRTRQRSEEHSLLHVRKNEPVDIVGTPSNFGGGKQAGPSEVVRSLEQRGARVLVTSVVCGPAEVTGVGLPTASTSRFWISALFLTLMTTCPLIYGSQFLAVTRCSRAQIGARIGNRCLTSRASSEGVGALLL